MRNDSWLESMVQTLASALFVVLCELCCVCHRAFQCSCLTRDVFQWLSDSFLEMHCAALRARHDAL